MMASRIRTLRSILSELRRSNCEGRKFGQSQGVRYILDQYREHQITGQKLCRHHEELSHLASTYLCYLNSSRRYKELHADYHGKTRSIEETARMVGFKMPILHNDKSEKET